jgi:hypothetical protein
MMDYLNPFEYEAANKLSFDKVLDFYIEDFNYSRFVCSRRNVFLAGERGTGKTMTLLYNSLPVQLLKAETKGHKPSLAVICVYIPCNTPLTHRKEYQLMPEHRASVISEHFLVAPIMYAIAETLSHKKDLLKGVDAANIRRELEYVLDMKLRDDVPLFDGLRQAFQRQVTLAQQAINTQQDDAFCENALSFSSGIMPMLTTLKRMAPLAESHFALMLDDAHILNEFQVRALNSWIAYRDNSVFSFKVATTKVDEWSFVTGTGGAILEGHDFTWVDMEQPYQNRYSDFGKLATQIISRRLEKVGVSRCPEAFFPVNPKFEAAIVKCKEQVKREAVAKYPNGTDKQIGDYVYKYGRAAYFRQRSSKANRPPYSGFEVLVHISTGVIRNLLEPCYWMYDKVVSENRRIDPAVTPSINEIPHSVQTEIILERSKKKWEWLRSGLDNSVENCSRVQAKQLYQLLDNLAILFRDRLLHHKSEPRAITFTISEYDEDRYAELARLLAIAREAQILYTYSSSAKDSGKRDTYYVPNRILWPDRGLDPQGQHARVSVRARHLWAAAKSNRHIPSKETEDSQEGDLFDGCE